MARWRWARPSSGRCWRYCFCIAASRVSADRLINEIWGEQPPASANKIVQGYVSNLRKLLGDGRLITQGRGYLLQIEPGQTDVDGFEALVAEGRRALGLGDGRAAGERFREALALWRGAPLADFAYDSFAQEVIARLEEERFRSAGGSHRCRSCDRRAGGAGGRVGGAGCRASVARAVPGAADVGPVSLR
jgi:DNA-binding SARP family transcriptional activator